MKRLLLRTATLLALSFMLVRPAGAAGFTQPRPAVLEGAAALDQPVTYSETKIPLGELVQKVATDTGVSLTAARAVADEPVAVVVKAMPARRLLEQVAELLDYRWSRQGHEGAWRYEIDQDLASQQREAALRQALMAAVEKRLQARLASYLQLAALPEDQFQAVLQEEQQQQTPTQALSPEQRQARAASPEEQARQQRLNDARQLWTPANRAIARLIGGLTPEQWITLREEGWFNFCTDPQPGEARLPADVAKIFRERQPGPPASARTAPQTDLAVAEAMRHGDEHAREQWAAASGYRVTIRYDADRFPSGGGLWLTATTFPLRSGAPMAPDPMDSEGWRRVFLYAGPEDLPEAQARDAEQTPERRAALERDPVVGVKKRFQPTFQPRRKPFGTGSLPLRFRDLLPDLARTYGVQILSDAYWTSSPRIDAPLPSEPVPLFTLLDAIAGATHRWSRDDDLIRLRSRTWFFDRPREIPLRMVRHWQQAAAKQGLLPFDDYVEMATALTDAQWDTLEQVSDQFDLPPGALWSPGPAGRDALRLYASLSPGEQQALWHGQPIPAAALAPSQRALFLAGLKAEIRRWYQPIPADLSHWEQGSFSLTNDRLIRTFLNGGSSAYFQKVDAAAGPAGASPSVPAVPPEIGTPVKVAPARVDRVSFQFQFGPGLSRSVGLNVAPLP